MDLQLYARVLRRFKLVVAAGLLVAGVLAVFSYARVSFVGGVPKLTYRTPVTYSSNETLLITQQGFPEGRSTFPVSKDFSFADPSRFTSLSAFYAYLANGDAVVTSAARLVGPHVSGKFVATPVVTTIGGNAELEPLLQIAGLGTSPAAAIRYAQAGSIAFRRYLDAQQSQAGIAPSQRVLVSLLNRATPPVVVSPRKKTLPIVVFVAVLAATLALVLVLENMRPQISAVASGAQEPELARPRATA